MANVVIQKAQVGRFDCFIGVGVRYRYRVSIKRACNASIPIPTPIPTPKDAIRTDPYDA